MKILNVNTFLDAKTGGGTAERLYQISRFLAKSIDIECSILCLESEFDSEVKQELANVNVTMLPYLNKRFGFPKAQFGRIGRAVKNADIVQLIGYWSVINSLAYFYARIYKKPFVVCPAGALNIFGRSKIIKNLYNFFVGNQMLKHASGYIAVSENEYEQFEEYGVSRDKVKHIPNAIAMEDSAVNNSAKLSRLPKTKYILFIGRLAFIKGPDLLLEAFAKIASHFSEYSLVIAGPDGGLLEQLKSLTKQYSLGDKVYFLGAVDRIEKKEVYAKCSLLVVPSRKEAMSFVAVEAGGFAKPVLATDQCGLDCLVECGAKLVKANSKAIADGIQNMLQDETELARLGKNWYQYVDENYSWNLTIRNVVSYFQGILNRTS